MYREYLFVISKYFSFRLVCRYLRSRCAQKRVVILVWSAPLWTSDSSKNWNVSESISEIPQCHVSLKIRVAGLEPLHAVSHCHADARSFAAFSYEREWKEEKFLYWREMLLVAHLVKKLPVIYVSQLQIITVFTRSTVTNCSLCIPIPFV